MENDENIEVTCAYNWQISYVSGCKELSCVWLFILLLQMSLKIVDVLLLSYHKQ